MDHTLQLSLLLFFYKVFTIAAGVFITYLGYRLFVKGIFNEAGDLDLSFKNNKLIMKKAAPGTFFTLFGAIIICFAVFRGLSLESKKSSGAPVASQAPPPLLEKPH
jgi:hypothetical protein